MVASLCGLKGCPHRRLPLRMCPEQPRRLFLAFTRQIAPLGRLCALQTVSLLGAAELCVEVRCSGEPWNCVEELRALAVCVGFFRRVPFHLGNRGALQNVRALCCSFLGPRGDCRAPQLLPGALPREGPRDGEGDAQFFGCPLFFLGTVCDALVQESASTHPEFPVRGHFRPNACPLRHRPWQ